MEEAVLLRQLVVEGQLDLHRAVLDAGQFRADEPHGGLPLEAPGDAAGEVSRRNACHDVPVSQPDMGGGLHGACCTASVPVSSGR